MLDNINDYDDARLRALQAAQGFVVQGEVIPKADVDSHSAPLNAENLLFLSEGVYERQTFRQQIQANPIVPSSHVLRRSEVQDCGAAIRQQYDGWWIDGGYAYPEAYPQNGQQGVLQMWPAAALALADCSIPAQYAAQALDADYPRRCFYDLERLKWSAVELPLSSATAMGNVECRAYIPQDYSLDSYEREAVNWPFLNPVPVDSGQGLMHVARFKPPSPPFPDAAVFEWQLGNAGQPQVYQRYTMLSSDRNPTVWHTLTDNRQIAWDAGRMYFDVGIQNIQESDIAALLCVWGIQGPGQFKFTAKSQQFGVQNGKVYLQSPGTSAYRALIQHHFPNAHFDYWLWDGEFYAVYLQRAIAVVKQPFKAEVESLGWNWRP